MFNEGDTVIYGMQGVCRIEGKEIRAVRGQYIEYYILKPVFDQDSTIYVPSKSEKWTAKMRPVMDRKEVEDLISLMPDEKTSWIEDDNERKTVFQNILSNGDRTEIMKMIKSIFLHRIKQEERGKRLHQVDEVVLDRAERLLYEEFAYVLNIDPKEVLPLISSRIGEKRTVQL